MQTVPGLVLCEKSEGTLIVFQQDAAGAQDIAHGGIVQVQLQQGADALQPVHQRIAVDEKLPGRGMEVLLLQQVDAQGVQRAVLWAWSYSCRRRSMGWMKARRLALWAMVRTNTS